MSKKNLTRFGIAFNPVDIIQKFAIDKLNSLPERGKSIYIAQAIYAFENGTKKVPNPNSEKRGRGRPRKKDVSTLYEDVSNTSDTPISSSHIQQSQQEFTAAEATPSKGVSDALVDSMLNFCGQ